ncbi:MAG: hypothetical protein ACYCSB_01320 [bacterium]|jgi:hypothetical protein
MKKFIRKNESGESLFIEDDDCPMNPREWMDNLSVITAYHKKYGIGDEEGNIDYDEFSNWNDVKKYLIAERGALHIRPLYMYEHGGIDLNIGSWKPYWDGFDAGQLGFVYTTAEKIKKMGTPENKIDAVIEEEIKVYGDYLNGDVYGYQIEDERGNEIESCYGFYGDEGIETIKSEFKSRI